MLAEATQALGAGGNPSLPLSHVEKGAKWLPSRSLCLGLPKRCALLCLRSPSL